MKVNRSTERNAPFLVKWLNSLAKALDLRVDPSPNEKVAWPLIDLAKPTAAIDCDQERDIVRWFLIRTLQYPDRSLTSSYEGFSAVHFILKGNWVSYYAGKGVGLAPASLGIPTVQRTGGQK